MTISTVGDLKQALDYLDDDTPIACIAQPNYPMVVSIVEVTEDVHREAEDPGCDSYEEEGDGICVNCGESGNAYDANHKRDQRTQAYLRLTDHEDYFQGDKYR